MKLVYLAIAALSVIGFSCTTEGPNHDVEDIMYLTLNDEDKEYYFEGSDINDSRTFLADVKENEAQTEYLSNCTSVLPKGTLDFTVVFIQATNQGEREPLELTWGTHTNSYISNDLRFAFKHTDIHGTTWECCVESNEDQVQNKITIEQIEPYSSKVNGNTKQLVTMSFEATMINSKGEIKTFNGHMKSIVEGQLP